MKGTQSFGTSRRVAAATACAILFLLLDLAFCTHAIPARPARLSISLPALSQSATAPSHSAVSGFILSPDLPTPTGLEASEIPDAPTVTDLRYSAHLVELPERTGELKEGSLRREGDGHLLYITAAAEVGGTLYLSGFATPKTDNSYGGRGEIAPLLEQLFQPEMMDITSQALTSMIRDNYTALLLSCASDSKAIQSFYAVDGALGAALTAMDGQLLWEVEVVTAADFSPATSYFTLIGASQVCRFTFDSGGRPAAYENTGNFVRYLR